jgi:hypothetical protein
VNIEANLRELERIDPGSDGFRYLLDRKRKGRSLPNCPEYVNLRVLHEAMEALSNFLSAVHSALRVRIQEIERLRFLEMEKEETHR